MLILLVKRKYRKSLLEKMGLYPKEFKKAMENSHPIWIHAVSVGEVISLIPLVKNLKKAYPSLPILLSTGTVTGNQTAREKMEGVNHFLFLPFDLPWIMRKTIRMVKPQLVLIAENEVWPNFFWEIRRQGIKSMLVNGRISDRSFKGYMALRFFFKDVLNSLSLFCMQSAFDAERIIQIGVPKDKVMVTGNMKFDSQWEIHPPEIERLRKELHLCDGSQVFIAGSTHEGEEEIILEAFNILKEKFPKLILIVAPRHPERFAEVETLAKRIAGNCFRRTELMNMQHAAAQVIILDTIGELAKIYALATVVFVGGSLINFGGHNPLEPASFGKPVLFGPSMEYFREISELMLKGGGSLQVKGREDLVQKCHQILATPSLQEEMGKRAHKVFQSHRGATEKTLERIKFLLEVNQRSGYTRVIEI